MKKIDLQGQRFGRWLVMEQGPKQKDRTTWLCQCDCGIVRVVRYSSLRRGDSVSCGCFAEELKVKHGKDSPGIYSPEYYTWSAMIQRCTNPKTTGYHNYGGRGISVCQEWKDSFMAFFKHMGNRPTPQHSIDRINNDGNYEPQNVQWATRREQNLNTRRSSRL